jgi:Cu(I)/Ag(I) efflux system periplasmic protein CusF
MFYVMSELLGGITVGDKVDFDVTVTGNAGEVTAIKKQ